MGSTRKTRNYKGKSSMLAFGHFVLPLAAIVALGMLFVGIKLFFLTPADRNGIDVVPNTTASRGEQDNTPSGGDAPDTPDTGEASQLAVGVASGDEGATTGTASQGDSPLLAGPIGSSGGAAGNVGGTAGQGTAGTGSATPQTGTSSGSGSSSAGRTRVSANAKWGVQIGAFQRAEGANSLVEQVTKEGYTATVTTATSSSGTTFHRVRVAAGDTKEEATRLSAELEKKGYPVLVVSN